MSNTPNQLQQLNHYQQIIDGFEQEIYVKNNQGAYLIANRYYIEALIELKLVNKDNPTIIGKTDFDLFSANTAQHFFENDQRVIASGVPHTFTEESRITARHTRRFISKKKPLYGATGKVEGVIGHSKRIDIVTLNQKKIELSKRELDCLSAIYKGLTAKKIAERLNLSKRTVESYIESLKIKMNCNNKAEIVKAILNNDLENALKYYEN